MQLWSIPDRDLIDCRRTVTERTCSLETGVHFITMSLPQGFPHLPVFYVYTKGLADLNQPGTHASRWQTCRSYTQQVTPCVCMRRCIRRSLFLLCFGHLLCNGQCKEYILLIIMYINNCVMRWAFFLVLWVCSHLTDRTQQVGKPGIFWRQTFDMWSFSRLFVGPHPLFSISLRIQTHKQLKRTLTGSYKTCKFSDTPLFLSHKTQ